LAGSLIPNSFSGTSGDAIAAAPISTAAIGAGGAIPRLRRALSRRPAAAPTDAHRDAGQRAQPGEPVAALVALAGYLHAGAAGDRLHQVLRG
jgi:hypothetical protein